MAFPGVNPLFSRVSALRGAETTTACIASSTYIHETRAHSSQLEAERKAKEIETMKPKLYIPNKYDPCSGAEVPYTRQELYEMALEILPGLRDVLNGDLDLSNAFTGKHSPDATPLEGYGSEVPRLSIADFNIEEVLGEGTFGTVWKGTPLPKSASTTAVYAIKQLSKHDIAEARMQNSIFRELRLLTRLRHENIVPLLGVDEDANSLFIFMPYGDSGTLQNLISCVKQRRLDAESDQIVSPTESGVEEAGIDGAGKGAAQMPTPGVSRPLLPESLLRFVAFTLLRALVHLHAHGVVFRDLKPDNVVLQSRRKGAEVNIHPLLIDFDFAKNVGVPNMTHTVRAASQADAGTSRAVLRTVSERSKKCCASADQIGFADSYHDLDQTIVHCARIASRTGEGPLVPRILRRSSCCGTPGYLAPEVVLPQGDCGEPSYDTKADVYALGAILWEMATGEVPFDATNTYKSAAEARSGLHGREASLQLGASARHFIADCLNPDPLTRSSSGDLIHHAWFSISLPPDSDHPVQLHEALLGDLGKINVSNYGIARIERRTSPTAPTETRKFCTADLPSMDHAWLRTGTI